MQDYEGVDVLPSKFNLEEVPVAKVSCGSCATLLLPLLLLCVLWLLRYAPPATAIVVCENPYVLFR